MNLISFKDYLREKISKVHLIPDDLKPIASKIGLFLLIGLSIRLFLMPLFASGDFLSAVWVTFTLVIKRQFIISNDPPAVFYIMGGFYVLMKPLFPQAFINYMSSNTAFTPPGLLQVFILQQPKTMTNLFLCKIPYLVFDILSAFVLLNLFNDGKKGYLAYRIWMLNPVILYVSYVIGQYDIIPVFFILASLYFLKRRKFSLAMLLLGISSVFKVFSLAFFPFYVLFYWKTKKEDRKTKIIDTLFVSTVGLLPVLVLSFTFSFVPQFYESVNFALPRSPIFNGFYGNTFYTRGFAGQPFVAGIFLYLFNYGVTFTTQAIIPDNIFVVPMAYVLILLVAAYQPEASFKRTCEYCAAFLLAFYAFSLFHPQWFLWVLPFLTVLAVENRRIFGRLLPVLFILFFVYILYWDATLSVALLVPVFPQALSWPGPVALMNNAGLPGTQIISLFRTIFSGICLFLIYTIIRTSMEDTKR
jgi:hypothetical protein